MVFTFRNEKPEQPDYTIAHTFGKRTKKGDVGIEVEVEGRRLPAAPSDWVAHQDGSLRGEESSEYVFANPVSFNNVDEKIDVLWKAFKDNDTRLDESIRTSVHVHLNVGGFHLNRLTSLLALWFTFEDVLTNWCGDRRVGNLFCLRAKDAPQIVTSFKRFIESKGQWRIPENNHYAGCNGNAIQKFCSIEFRMLRGVTKPEPIKTWVRILRKMYELSADYPDPRVICEQFSLDGPIAFFNHVFGEEAGKIREDVRLGEDYYVNSLYEGIRFAQDLCYCRDWSRFNPKEVKEDPFGRIEEGIADPALTALQAQMQVEANRIRNDGLDFVDDTEIGPRRIRTVRAAPRMQFDRVRAEPINWGDPNA